MTNPTQTIPTHSLWYRRNARAKWRVVFSGSEPECAAEWGRLMDGQSSERLSGDWTTLPAVVDANQRPTWRR